MQQQQLRRTARSGERSDFLQTLVNTSKLTQDGKDWLITALDPFHDFSHPIAGYPDADTSQTVVSLYQYQTTITAPPGVPGEWDAHLYTLPLTQLATHNIVTESADWSNCAEQAANVQVNMSLLNIAKGAPGTALTPQVIPIPATTVHSGLPGNYVNDLISGNSRIIGMGFEVHNTTSDLYKQGAVTTYRMPQMPAPHCVHYSTSGGVRQSNITGNRFCTAPAYADQAQRLKSCRTWAARDGVYANCFQSSISNPITRESSWAAIFAENSGPGAAGVASVSYMNPVAATEVTPYAQKSCPFDTTGAFFSGLSQQTTLLVKLRVYVERAPTYFDATLAPLATPSAGYDVAALQLYAQAINMLPCAVKVDENAVGDWFRAVVSVLKHAAGPIGMGLNTFLPGAGLVGHAVQSVLQQFDARKPIAKQAVTAAKANAPRVKLQAKQLLAQKAKLKPIRK